MRDQPLHLELAIDEAGACSGGADEGTGTPRRDCHRAGAEAFDRTTTAT